MLAWVGHLYGFGNTLDKALTAVVGCKRRSVAVRWTDRSTTRLERDGREREREFVLGMGQRPRPTRMRACFCF